MEVGRYCTLPYSGRCSYCMSPQITPLDAKGALLLLITYLITYLPTGTCL